MGLNTRVAAVADTGLGRGRRCGRREEASPSSLLATAASSTAREACAARHSALPSAAPPRGGGVLRAAPAGHRGQRARARPRRAGDRDGRRGQSLDDRDETLAGVVTSFAIGGPIAVALASLLGYGLATAGLRPVEAMRRRARQVSLASGDERLPLPKAEDEIRRLGETLNEMLDRLGAHSSASAAVADASHELRTRWRWSSRPELALRAGPDRRTRGARGSRRGVRPPRPARGGPARRRPRRRGRATGTDGIARRERAARANAAALRGPRPRARARIRVEPATGSACMRTGCGSTRRSPISSTTRCAMGGRRLGQALTAPAAAWSSRCPTPARASREFAERAFERFARGDELAPRTGTGLGLSIVGAIAQAHGGRAEIAPGRGATVRIWLPDAPEDGSGPSRVAAVTSGSRQDETDPRR